MHENERDLVEYLRDLSVIASHLEAAQEASTGLYLHNPATHKVPMLGDVKARVEEIRRDIIAAQEAANDRLNRCQ